MVQLPTSSVPSDRPASGRPSVLGRVPPERISSLVHRLSLAPVDHLANPLRAPFTNEVIAELPLGVAADVEQAVVRARQAQADWAGTSVRDRARVFLRFHDLLLDRQSEVLDLIQLENGKARRFAFEEVADTANVCRHYATRAGEMLSPKRRRGALPGLTLTWERRQPLGVVGFVCPWNYPLILSITDAIPALIAGNAAVIKPDLRSPLSLLWAASLLDEAGLPPDLLHVLNGRGGDLGPPLIDRVDFLCFTGSTATGRAVAKQAAERLIGCSLELGGKNPMIVLADADLERAVGGALSGCFTNTGQCCVSIERLYVHASLYDPFLARFARGARELRMGASFEFDTDVGSLTTAEQLAKALRHVDDAVSKGAALAAGGKARPDLGPLFFEPTILVGVREGMEVFAEETFGPVVSVYRFRSEEEAVQLANATPYGLNAAIWTSRPRRGRELATHLRAGTVNVNESYAATWGSTDAPMGGVKQSGLGRRHGEEGLLKYTEAQTIAYQRLGPIGPPGGISDRQFARLVTWMLRWVRRLPGLR